MSVKTELSSFALQGTRVSGDDVVIEKTAPVPVDNTTGRAVHQEGLQHQIETH
jgi:hypothetical protein